jgi:molybdopterin-binding protein
LIQKPQILSQFSIIKASLTHNAMADLGLKMDDATYAIVKASNIMIGVGH